MTRQLDTIITQLGNIQQAVHTMPTWTALEGTLASINAAIRDLSHRVAAPPPQAPAPTRPPIPPTGATARQDQPTLGPPFPRPGRPHFLPLSPKHVLPPLARTPHPLSTPTYPGMMWTPDPFTATPGPTPISSLNHGRGTRSERGNTLTPPP